jgi:hypothetical protein
MQITKKYQSNQLADSLSGNLLYKCSAKFKEMTNLDIEYTFDFL